MVKRMLALAFIACLAVFSLCACSSDEYTSNTSLTGEDSWITSPKDYEVTESDESFAYQTASRLFAENNIDYVPENLADMNMSMYVNNDGRRFFDCMIFSDNNEHSVFLAFDSKGEIHAMDVDQKIIHDYTSEYIEALGNASPINLR